MTYFEWQKMVDVLHLKTTCNDNLQKDNYQINIYVLFTSQSWAVGSSII